MGPLITKEHLQKVRSYVDLGEKEGAKLIVDGRNFKIKDTKMVYIGGCLFDKVTKNMKIYKEEIFGPVLSIVRAKDFDEALKLVNDHEFGNGVSIFTRDGTQEEHFLIKLKLVWLVSIYLFQFQWPFMISAAGKGLVWRPAHAWT